MQEQQESAFLQRLRYLQEMTPEERIYNKLKKRMEEAVDNGRYAESNEFTFIYLPHCRGTAYVMKRFSEDGLHVEVKSIGFAQVVSVVIPCRK